MLVLKPCKLRSCVLCNDKLKVLTGHNRQIYSQMVHPFTVYDCILLISSQIGIKQETFKHCFNSCFIFTACGNYTYGCLLYTSDAADDMQCVDLGGRRIIKK